MKWFKITGDTRARVATFGVSDDATEEEIAQAAHDAVSEYMDYGWEEIDAPKEE